MPKRKQRGIESLEQEIADLKKRNADLQQEVNKLNVELHLSNNEIYYLHLEKFCWNDGFYARRPLYEPPDGDVERVEAFMKSAKTPPEWRCSEKFKTKKEDDGAE